MLPASLKAKAATAARKAGVSLGEWIRRALAASLRRSGKGERDEDSLFADKAVFKDKGAADMSRAHDRYLYGDGH